MCLKFFKRKDEEELTPPLPQRPEWVIHSPTEVAHQELEAAAIHYTWMTLIEDGTLPQGYEEIGGDYAHHEHWWLFHQEAAYYTDPVYTLNRLGQ